MRTVRFWASEETENPETSPGTYELPWYCRRLPRLGLHTLVLGAAYSGHLGSICFSSFDFSSCGLLFLQVSGKRDTVFQ